MKKSESKPKKKVNKKVVEAGKLIVDEFIKNYESNIKSIWIIPPKEKEINMIFLIDDTLEISKDKIDEMKLAASLISKKIFKKYKITFVTQFQMLTDYWEAIKNGNPAIISEIRDGVSVYDPSGFFVPIKKLIQKGRVPGTKEAMKELIAHSPDELAKLKTQIKVDIISSMFDMIVDLSHALLIANGVSPPIPKKIPEYLRRHIVKKGILKNSDVEKIEYVIKFWKDVEHGRIKIDDITSNELDNIIESVTSYVDDVELVLK